MNYSGGLQIIELSNFKCVYAKNPVILPGTILSDSLLCTLSTDTKQKQIWLFSEALAVPGIVSM
jgi:hypothetical protein